jgi:lincosamide nucleotidyltransferase A/C/D/E
MVQAQDVVRIVPYLTAQGVRVWLTGGWGIDALLGEQTRPHKDLDILMLVDDVASLRDLLARQGYTLKELWSENRWVVDARGTQVPTAFVLHDAAGRELDAHALWLDERGRGIPAWLDDGGLVFEADHLAGEGRVAGVPVPCLSPAMQVRCHTGYDLPDAQRRDMERLRERFGLDSGSELPPT